jgi:RNA polymerase sigma-32 factor
LTTLPACSGRTNSPTTADQEAVLGDAEEFRRRSGMLRGALTQLNDRERHILVARRLRDEPATLNELSRTYGLFNERIRQIEIRAFDKLRRDMGSVR